MSPRCRGRARETRRVSPFERAILAWIADYQAAHGVCPTSAEVRAGMRMGRSTCHEHLAALARAGLIRRRSIELVAVARRGLSAAELAWCQANAARVRAMIAVAGEVVS